MDGNSGKLVSIILSVYNNIEDIDSAINSVVRQTYVRWELIIVDDCSTDGTYEHIMDRIKKELDGYNIKLLRNDKNMGCYVSMNRGVLESKGDYITRLDSDDMFVPKKLELQVKMLDRFTNAVAIEALFNREERLYVGEITFMFRREVFDKIGYFDSVRFAGDTEFMYRMFKVFGKERVKKINRVLYYAKKRKGSLTTSISSGLMGKGRMIRDGYVREFNKWHKECENTYMEFPLKRRPFSVHSSMLP